MKLSIIVPVYNEKKTISKIISMTEKVNLTGIKKEIVIVDDFSIDGTREILKKINNRNIKIIYHNKNRGKGSAIKTALSHVTGDIVITQDADLEYDPEEYCGLIKIMKERGARAVYGSRALKKENKYPSLSHYIGNFLLNMLTNILYSSKLTDMETCYKLIDRKLLQSLNLKSKRFDIEPEITAKILKRGIKIHEVPINFYPRTFKDGKKIKWRDGLIAVYTLLKYKFFD